MNRPKNTRRKGALARLQAQLKGQQSLDPKKDYVLPEESINRIKREIETLVARIF